MAIMAILIPICFGDPKTGLCSIFLFLPTLGTLTWQG